MVRHTSILQLSLIANRIDLSQWPYLCGSENESVLPKFLARLKDLRNQEVDDSCDPCEAVRRYPVVFVLDSLIQVWTLTIFLPMGKKSLICLENQWPLIGETLCILFRSSQQLPRLRLGPWRAFWVVTAPSKGPRLASCVASRTKEKQGHRQVCHARCEGPGRPSITSDANLDCAFVVNHTPLRNWLK